MKKNRKNRKYKMKNKYRAKPQTKINSNKDFCKIASCFTKKALREIFEGNDKAVQAVLNSCK